MHVCLRECCENRSRWRHIVCVCKPLTSMSAISSFTCSVASNGCTSRMIVLLTKVLTKTWNATGTAPVGVIDVNLHRNVMHVCCISVLKM